MKPSIISIIAFTITSLLLSSCAKQESGTALIVGMELSYPPFEMTDERNQPSGISVDMASALADYLGKDLKIENIPFPGLIPALRTGKIDLIISSMTRTEERAQSISFSNAYLDTGLCILVSKDNGADSFEEIDVEGGRIAVKQGTTGHIFANERVKNAEILIFEKEAAASLEVAQGKVDAFIYDQISVYSSWRKHAQSTRALLNPVNQESWAIGVQKGDPDLLGKVNAFLDQFESEGGFEDLGDKYLSEEKRVFKELGYPFFF